MPGLQDILYKVPIIAVHGDTSQEVTDLQTDSREVKEGSVFIAIRGTLTDGHAFIEKAIANKASVIVCEDLPGELSDDITYIQVKHSAYAAGLMAHNFYGQPSERLHLIGVTGTNGKTTIATLLFKLFSELGYHCGLISTVNNRIGKEVITSTHTTPDAIRLNALLKSMADSQCAYVFMETSSHALHQQRVAGLYYTGAVFSNISHDHLDYHKTFDEYIRVKKSFFDMLPSTAFALSNADDKRGAVMLQNTSAAKYFYSLKTMAEFKGKILENSLSGLIMNINDQEVHFNLIGEFNAYNLLAVYGTAICLGQNSQEVLTALSGITGAEGRFDYFISESDKLISIVDYAHSPDALENVLETIRDLRSGNEKIITVVGCGGDRDKAKRPVMGTVACQLSDRAIFTSDNPRSEDPSEIIADMESELSVSHKRKMLSIADRKEAIKTAVALAQPGDIILVAGKGHEKYQEIKGVKYPFDDKEILKEIIRSNNR